MKYLFVSLHIQNGDYEYFSNSVHALNSRRNLKKYAENYPKDFYAGKPEKDGENYLFNAGEVAVRLNDSKEIRKEDFEVLSRFI